MTSEKPSAKKVFSTIVIASALFGGMPAFAKEGAAPKQGFFSNSDASSPFTEESREDPLFSPYSPYGNGEAAVYNSLKGSPSEIKFYSEKFDESVKRVAKVPGYVQKKTWFEIKAGLVGYAYNLRNAALKLAEFSKDPTAATKAAKVYFDDLNDINEYGIKKDGAKVLAAYDKSLKDLAAFKALVK
eukprot:CAMPEP_0196761110 /NCGR_PEP_ID=MMETSP1095-20130614/227_1 /TAXON_ID=96789 ORGANISM="Chromulina nebulosa, Strain UTEXLB2642" /NCGR_SAMPLE_ID=MMETSP1095 /ASSEMBLY_ACC=CAM_ASM_000446 /LENGTH=185 /DNA_ID=CAMNT_0042110223 /DNA_START=127 /DNA_END=684 /DNA_ORIENTATION=+